MPLKPIAILPNLVTLANAFCGLLALSKAVDALTASSALGVDADVFYRHMETACFLVFLAMVFDALDGWVARVTHSASEFGAQLDSFADFLTFGVVPAILAKVLIEHEGPLVDYSGNSRLHFLAAAGFSMLALLRLARFTLETEPDPDSHKSFKGLPSPAAAGALVSWIWMYLILRRPELEVSVDQRTPVGVAMGWIRGFDWAPFMSWAPVLLVVWLPVLGLLMVSRVRYAHGANLVTERSSPFSALVMVLFICFLLYLAPVPVLFVVFNGFVLLGLLGKFLGRSSRANASRA